jgi:hypothetical protein
MPDPHAQRTAARAVRRERRLAPEPRGFLPRVPRGRPSAFTQADLLEHLNTLPAGTVLTPIDNHPIVVHVDGVRHQSNRHERISPPDPIIRVLVGDPHDPGTPVYHVRGVSFTSPAQLAEDYQHPLPLRTTAICVLYVYGPVTIVQGLSIQ